MFYYNDFVMLFAEVHFFYKNQ